ncbi:Aste57867_12544 [Aphanomyces stellatus]|uniref:Aste57867_12544 protein n=1 Tax=Aphanomyces stellatus TaxID=120398 RepID=A0A485KXU8_9STRA|nr:hypothetical protein As57867_012498 [Aphanomyces stellatus]VFT89395.1 Aste57867_12544 [Aphanomyces stellatus]
MIGFVVLVNMSQGTPHEIAQICAQNPSYVDICTTTLSETVDFVATYVASHLVDIDPVVQQARAAIRALNVEFLQFGHVNASSPLDLFRIHILEPFEVEFTYFTWNFILDCALGAREAVALAGDTGNVVVLTGYLNFMQLEVNVDDAPTMMAVYLRNTVAFVTVAMIVIASVMLLYIMVSHGSMEGWNIFQLGPPCGSVVLLFVRNLTAIAL